MKYTCSMETVQQNGRFTLFSIKFLSIYSILYVYKYWSWRLHKKNVFFFSCENSEIVEIFNFVELWTLRTFLSNKMSLSVFFPMNWLGYKDVIKKFRTIFFVRPRNHCAPSPPRENIWILGYKHFNWNGNICFKTSNFLDFPHRAS